MIGGRRIALGLGGEERAGIGMARIGEYARGLPSLDDFSLAHDDHVVSDAPDDVEVMGDEQHGHAKLGLQVLQEFEDLRLNSDIERGRRLIGDQKIGAIGQRHGDHHPLALSAGELMRIGAKPLCRIDDADLGQKFHDPRWRDGSAAVVKRNDLADLPLDRMERIKRRHRLLKHHGDGVAAHRAQFVDGHFEHVAAAEEDLAASGSWRRAAAGGAQSPAR